MVNKFLFCSTFEHESFEMGLKKKRYCVVADSELMSTEIYVHTPFSPKLEAWSAEIQWIFKKNYFYQFFFTQKEKNI